jgi:threonyl-tRNA synthetase
VYARQDQLQTEVGQLVADVQSLYSALDMPLRARLSFRDASDKYLGDEKLWELAQGTITDLAKQNKLDYFEAEGEAAFYGPKIDFMATDAIGREHQVATVQLDFVQPERFGLEYADEHGEKQRPVMIHCAILGSIERFMSGYIEHTAGRFPLWVAPEQLRIIQVKDTDEVVNFVQQLVSAAREKGLRVNVDGDNQSVGKKIRDAEVWKVPYTLVIGEKEVQAERLKPRVRSDLAVLGDVEREYEVDQFLQSLANEVKARASKSSL